MNHLITYNDYSLNEALPRFETDLKEFVTKMRSLEKEFKDKGVQLEIQLGGYQSIYISKIVVPIEHRSEGIGSEFLKRLTDLADEYGVYIQLSPADTYGGTVSRLKKLYYKFGFFDNKGRKRDDRFWYEMLREPKENRYGKKKIDEGLLQKLGGLAKFALALPKLMQYLGFASEYVGAKLDSPIGHKIAEFLTDHGKDLEEKYQDNLSKVVGPLLKDPSKKEAVTKDLIYALTAKNAGAAFAGKENMGKDPRRSVMNVLDSIDQKNIADNVGKMYPNLIK